MITVEEYSSQFEGQRRVWLEAMIEHMRTNTNLEESMEKNVPTYRGYDFYIALAPNKNYFSFYTDATEYLEIFTFELPGTMLGKTCARISYKEQYAVNVMCNITRDIMMVHRDPRRDSVSELSAIQKWKSIPEELQRRFCSNTFCMKCGTTTIAEGFAVHENPPFGIILRGKCKSCGKEVARVVQVD